MMRISASVLLFFFALSLAQAVVLFRTGDSLENTTAPGDDRSTVWSLQGEWGNFLGTPISPKHFITAKHIGGSIGQVFTFQGSSFTAVNSFTSLDSDLRIWEVDTSGGGFASYAELYTKTDELGKELFVMGRGTQRGAEVNVTGASPTDLRGWMQGTADHVKRWGENSVSGTQVLGSAGDQLIATFSRTSPFSEEAALTEGDSGGGVFIRDTSDNQWKLAGINYAITGQYNFADDNNTEFNATIFDEGGLYVGNDASGYTLQSDTLADKPGAFFSTRISSYDDWIVSVIPEPNTISLLLLTLVGLCRRRRINH